MGESKEGRKCQIVTEKNNLEISCERIRRDARVLGSIDRRSFERESISRVQSRVSSRGSSASARPRATDFDSLLFIFFIIFDTLFLSPLDKREREGKKEKPIGFFGERKKNEEREKSDSEQ